MDILDFWALKSPPRDAQVKTLLWLQKNKDKKYLFCDLPVGAGKSAIGVTYANYINASQTNISKASYILTPQKILQTQYEQSFMVTSMPHRYMSSMYGQSNYSCSNKKTSCSIGGLLQPRCGVCPYIAAKKLAVESKHVIFNYALALAVFNYTDAFESRSVMVFDECHNIENILTDYNNVTLTASSCESHGVRWVKSRVFSEVLTWIQEEYYPRVDEILTQLSDDCDYLLTQSSLTREETHKLQKLYSLTEHLTLVHNFMTTDIVKLQKQFVLTQDKDMIKFKYLFGRDNFRRILQHKADKFLFMSATIFDAIEMCKCLGIPEDDMAYMSVESDFPKDSRPVVYSPIMKMNYGWDNNENKSHRKRMISAINDIQSQHLNNHGIIHTGNYAISNWLVDELNNNKTHQILHHNVGSTDSRDNVIKMFMNAKKPTILISPSITEGLDLVGDKARFAIFAKIPFGAMGDAWIKKRMEISDHWYKIRALTDVMQGCGRIVRSKDDWGVVYILDASWSYLYNNINRYIPKWWKDGYLTK